MAGFSLDSPVRLQIKRRWVSMLIALLIRRGVDRSAELSNAVVGTQTLLRAANLLSLGDSSKYESPAFLAMSHPFLVSDALEFSTPVNAVINQFIATMRTYPVLLTHVTEGEHKALSPPALRVGETDRAAIDVSLGAYSEEALRVFKRIAPHGRNHIASFEMMYFSWQVIHPNKSLSAQHVRNVRYGNKETQYVHVFTYDEFKSALLANGVGAICRDYHIAASMAHYQDHLFHAITFGAFTIEVTKYNNFYSRNEYGWGVKVSLGDKTIAIRKPVDESYRFFADALEWHIASISALLECMASLDEVAFLNAMEAEQGEGEHPFWDIYEKLSLCFFAPAVLVPGNMPPCKTVLVFDKAVRTQLLSLMQEDQLDDIKTLLSGLESRNKVLPVKEGEDLLQHFTYAQNLSTYTFTEDGGEYTAYQLAVKYKAENVMRYMRACYPRTFRNALQSTSLTNLSGVSYHAESLLLTPTLRGVYALYHAMKKATFNMLEYARAYPSFINDYRVLTTDTHQFAYKPILRNLGLSFEAIKPLLKLSFAYLVEVKESDIVFTGNADGFTGALPEGAHPVQIAFLVNETLGRHSLFHHFYDLMRVQIPGRTVVLSATYMPYYYTLSRLLKTIIQQFVVDSVSRDYERRYDVSHPDCEFGATDSEFLARKVLADEFKYIEDVIVFVDLSTNKLALLVCAYRENQALKLKEWLCEKQHNLAERDYILIADELECGGRFIIVKDALLFVNRLIELSINYFGIMLYDRFKHATAVALRRDKGAVGAVDSVYGLVGPGGHNPRRLGNEAIVREASSEFGAPEQSKYWDIRRICSRTAYQALYPGAVYRHIFALFSPKSFGDWHTNASFELDDDEFREETKHWLTESQIFSKPYHEDAATLIGAEYPLDRRGFILEYFKHIVADIVSCLQKTFSLWLDGSANQDIRFSIVGRVDRFLLAWHRLSNPKLFRVKFNCAPQLVQERVLPKLQFIFPEACLNFIGGSDSLWYLTINTMRTTLSLTELWETLTAWMPHLEQDPATVLKTLPHFPGAFLVEKTSVGDRFALKCAYHAVELQGVYGLAHYFLHAFLSHQGVGQSVLGVNRTGVILDVNYLYRALCCGCFSDAAWQAFSHMLAHLHRMVREYIQKLLPMLLVAYEGGKSVSTLATTTFNRASTQTASVAYFKVQEGQRLTIEDQRRVNKALQSISPECHFNYVACWGVYVLALNHLTIDYHQFYIAWLKSPVYVQGIFDFDQSPNSYIGLTSAQLEVDCQVNKVHIFCKEMNWIQYYCVSCFLEYMYGAANFLASDGKTMVCIALTYEQVAAYRHFSVNTFLSVCARSPNFLRRFLNFILGKAFFDKLDEVHQDEALVVTHQAALSFVLIQCGSMLQEHIGCSRDNNRYDNGFRYVLFWKHLLHHMNPVFSASDFPGHFSRARANADIAPNKRRRVGGIAHR